jgi:hypothetical protein
MANNKVSSAHLRIDFTVREVLEGEDQSSARYVTFGDDVDIESVKDFFERCGISVDLLFHGRRSGKVIKLSGPTHAAIQAIKAIRQLTGVGLKEAKDAFERARNSGSAMVAFPDGRYAEEGIQVFKASGFNECEVIEADVTVALKQGALPYVHTAV